MRKTALAWSVLSALAIAAAAPCVAVAKTAAAKADVPAVSARWRAAQPSHRHHARRHGVPRYSYVGHYPGHYPGPGPYPYGPGPYYRAAPFPFFPYFGYGFAW